MQWGRTLRPSSPPCYDGCSCRWLPTSEALALVTICHCPASSTSMMWCSSAPSTCCPPCLPTTSLPPHRLLHHARRGWLPSTQHPPHPPYVWRAPFLSSVQQALVSTDNPAGSITNSDLELVGTIAHEATLAMVHDLCHCTIATFSDNTLAVAWGNKASTTTAGPTSYLLRSSSLLQCQHWYLSQQFYIPGPANHLADFASRRFDLSNDALLAFLDSVAPHTQPWQMLHLPPVWLSRLTTDLQRRRHVWPSLASVPPPKIVSGPNTGPFSPMSSAWTPFLQPWKTRYRSSAFWRIEFGMAKPAGVVNQSGLSAYVTRSWPSQRVSPTWDSWIGA